MDWKKESEMFNQAANYYDKYRPSYPVEIIEELVEKAELSRGAELLEIGSGSGKATELFVNRGFNIMCIEPGKELVDIGNYKFAEENFVFKKSRFEELDIEKEKYDAIFSAQAFHWVPQPVGYEKCAYGLKSRGYLALFWNMYIVYENEIDKELLKISNKYGGLADFLSEEQCEERIASIVSGIENSRLFESPKVYRKLWTQKYTADEFYGFVLTGNRFIQKSDEEKQSAYEEIKELANKYGGVIERPYLCVLYMAQRL